MVERLGILAAICFVMLVMPGCESVPVGDGNREETEVPRQETRRPSTEAPAQSASARLREEGVRRLEAGDTERASSWFERAIRIDPDSAENYYQLARVRVLEGFHAEARELLLRARSLLDSQGVGAGELVGAIERLLAYVASQSAR